jgi:hypothetical protein
MSTVPRCSINGASVSYAETIEHWQTSQPFLTFIAALPVDSPYQAYFWEAPPLSRATAGRAFEFVFVDGPEVAVMAREPRAFADHFRQGSQFTWGRLLPRWAVHRRCISSWPFRCRLFRPICRVDRSPIRYQCPGQHNNRGT